MGWLPAGRTKKVQLASTQVEDFEWMRGVPTSKVLLVISVRRNRASTRPSGLIMGDPYTSFKKPYFAYYCGHGCVIVEAPIGWWSYRQIWMVHQRRLLPV
jgi:hypothetical protein